MWFSGIRGHLPSTKHHADILCVVNGCYKKDVTEIGHLHENVVQMDCMEHDGQIVTISFCAMHYINDRWFLFWGRGTVIGAFEECLQKK